MHAAKTSPIHADAELHRVLDELNEEIEATEDHFEEQGFRTRASVALPSGGLVIWTKDQRGWVLMTRLASGTEVRLTDASASRRIEAALHLAALAVACRNQQAGVVQGAASAAESLRALRSPAEVSAAPTKRPQEQEGSGRYITVLAVIEVPDAVRNMAEDDLVQDAMGLLSEGWGGSRVGRYAECSYPSFVIVTKGVSGAAMAAGADAREEPTS